MKKQKDLNPPPPPPQQSSQSNQASSEQLISQAKAHAHQLRGTVGSWTRI